MVYTEIGVILDISTNILDRNMALILQVCLWLDTFYHKSVGKKSFTNALFINKELKTLSSKESQ